MLTSPTYLSVSGWVGWGAGSSGDGTELDGKPPGPKSAHLLPKTTLQAWVSILCCCQGESGRGKKEGANAGAKNGAARQELPDARESGADRSITGPGFVFRVSNFGFWDLGVEFLGC